MRSYIFFVFHTHGRRYDLRTCVQFNNKEKVQKYVYRVNVKRPSVGQTRRSWWNVQGELFCPTCLRILHQHEAHQEEPGRTGRRDVFSERGVQSFLFLSFSFFTFVSFVSRLKDDLAMEKSRPGRNECTCNVKLGDGWSFSIEFSRVLRLYVCFLSLGFWAKVQTPDPRGSTSPPRSRPSSVAPPDVISALRIYRSRTATRWCVSL